MGKKDGIAHFLKSLVTPAPGQKLTVRICASSRDWNVFGLLLSKNPHLTLQNWTIDDIKRFASERLGEAERDGSEELLHEITRRAEGVFLWVKLVVDELLEPLFNGEPMSKLTSLLSSLPDELPDFYERMLSNISNRDRETAIRMIEITLASGYYPICLSEFSLAVDLLRPDSSLPKDLNLDHAEEAKRCKEMQRRGFRRRQRVVAGAGAAEDFGGVGRGIHTGGDHAGEDAGGGGAQGDAYGFEGPEHFQILVRRGLERVMRLVIQLFSRMDDT